MVGGQQPQVDDGQPVHPEGAQIVLDTRAQLLGSLRGHPAAVGVTHRPDLGDEGEVVGVGLQRLADQRVGDVRAVVLRRVDVVRAELDGATQDRDGLAVVPGRTEDARAGKLHRAEADAPYRSPGQRVGGGHAATLADLRRR